MNTKKKLLAYQINGQTIGIDIHSWDTNDLSGNTPFLIITSGDTIPNGYTDITSILYWDSYGSAVANDYLVVKFEIKDIITQIGWTGLTNTEKDLAIKYFAYPDTMSAIIYLMTDKGMTQQEAQGYILLSWHKHHGHVLDSCKQRWYYVKFIVPQFLSFADSEDLFDTCETLVYQYTEMGRLGIDYSDNNDGIMDYLMSTHGFTGQGMEENNYTLLQGTWAIFKEELRKVLVCGLYIRYNKGE